LLICKEWVTRQEPMLGSELLQISQLEATIAEADLARISSFAAADCTNELVAESCLEPG
jgi:hypothetical protein